MEPARYEGWFAEGVRLQLGEGPRDGWTTAPGPTALLVLYSSRRTVGVFDKGVFTDELVVELTPSERSAGGTLPLAGRVARYQQGATKLQFVSLHLDGELRLEVAGAGRLRGSFDLRAAEPTLDVLSVGGLSAAGEFEVVQRTT